ncbi:hypothetical protein Pelo_3747 [Pelomyxa schiedti]|nr:hypothetical protein Pelo_3747 [Pelomyxa schiedti]
MGLFQSKESKTPALASLAEVDRRAPATTKRPADGSDSTRVYAAPLPFPLKRTNAPLKLRRSPKRPRVRTPVVFPPGAGTTCSGVPKRKLAPTQRQHGRWVRTNIEKWDRTHGNTEPEPEPKTETTHKVERSLAEQLLAFACASHPTCGARSAAALMWRHDGLPANLRRVIAESDLFFAVCVTAPKFRVFHFGVSPLTLGVSAEPREVYVKHMQCRKATFADLSHIIFVKKELLSHSRARYLLIDALTGRKEILLQGTHSYTRHTANHQWWVCYDLHDKVLHVENLVEKRYICCAAGDIDVPKYTGAFMYLSKINRNELVICIEQLSSGIFRHYLPNMFLGLAHRESGHKMGTNGLILRTKHANLVTGDLFHVVEAKNSSKCKQLSSYVTALEQVDFHRFCISKQDRYEIWGYTGVNEETPHQLKEITCFLPLEPLTTVFAEAGFLFKVQRVANSIEVRHAKTCFPIFTVRLDHAWKLTITQVV